jgi:hypothetical protein
VSKQDKLPLAKTNVNDFGDFDPAHPDPVADFTMPVSPEEIHRETHAELSRSQPHGTCSR